jgi:23S rRNA (cytosine1962-C5)-methyltransferase
MKNDEKDYELLDSGENEKLERFGAVVLRRPDPQALWPKRLTTDEWTARADGRFVRNAEEGKWVMKDAGVTEGEKSAIPKSWPIEYAGLKFLIKPTPFKHVGLFPEQKTNWHWLRKVISDEFGELSKLDSAALGKNRTVEEKENNFAGNEIEVLNLFGYTGGATLACAQAGAKVVHVDGSKSAIAWARENAELSELSGKPIRWILDDARAFVARELKRGRRYDGIIMDPPAFGHGSDGELWKIEDHFLPLVADCLKLLKQTDTNSGATSPLFFLINGYSAGYSAIAYENNLLPLKEKFGGTIEIGELTIEESTHKEKADVPRRLLPAGIFARWSAK